MSSKAAEIETQTNKTRKKLTENHQIAPITEQTNKNIRKPQA